MGGAGYGRQGYLDELQFFCPFQEYFSHIRTMLGVYDTI